jgi:hypothetical protein
VALRRSLAPLLNAGAGAVAGGTAIAIAALLWWSPGRAFEGWVTGLTLIALVIAAVVAMRRRTLEEFPDTRMEETADRLRARFVPRRSAGGIRRPIPRR